MRDIATSTIVSLLYAKKPSIDFRAYVAELELGLRNTQHENITITWEYDDFVVFDIDGSRVVAAYSDTLGIRDGVPARADGSEGEPYAALLLLAVGYGLKTSASTLVADHRDDMCRAVLRRLQKRHEADVVLWRTFERPLTSQDFDDLIHDMPRQPLPRTNAASDGARAERFGDPQVARLIERWQSQFAGAGETIDAQDAVSDDVTAETPRAKPRLVREHEVSPPAVNAQKSKTTAADDEDETATDDLLVSIINQMNEEERAPVMAQAGASGFADSAVPFQVRRNIQFARPKRRSENTLRHERPRPLGETPKEAVANDIIDIPHPMVSEMQRIREALYQEHVNEAAKVAAVKMRPSPDAKEKGTLPQRLTIYSLNCTLMVVALPVGAALMTYNCLGREDMRVTSRVMALTGTAIAFAQSGLLGQFFQSFV